MAPPGGRLTPVPAAGFSARRVRAQLRLFYEGDMPWMQRARGLLLFFDIAVLLFVVATSFISSAGWVGAVDVAIGLLLLCEFSARLLASRNVWREVKHPWTWLDAVAIGSFLLPLAGEALGFLRALRLVRVLHVYRVLDLLRATSGLFRRNEEAFIASTNLAVFVYVMTGLVYTTQHWSNPQIANYADALYFTITSLTTTGYGDITLPGTTGRMLSVVIMLAGVTLFLRLAQAMFRPSKVRFPCPSCGLQRHEPDAVHCKSCGVVLCIPDEGDD